MRLVIKADLKPLCGRLDRLAARMQNLMPMMDAIGGILESSTRQRLAETKTSPDGSKWKPLAASTIKAKSNRNGQQRGSILVDSGNLLRSITHEATADSVIAGSVMNYARFHQEGTRRMPARPFLGLSANDYRDINELLADWAAGLIEE